MLAAWIYLAMSTWKPPLTETDEVRYIGIAEDIAEIAQENPVFENDTDFRRTSALLASIAYYESAYRADVDDGTTLGDAGAAHCIMQVHLRPGESADERKSCLRIAINRIRESFSMCRNLRQEDQLSGYTRGHCEKAIEAEWRMNRAENWWKSHGFSDEVDSHEPGTAD